MLINDVEPGFHDQVVLWLLHMLWGIRSLLENTVFLSQFIHTAEKQNIKGWFAYSQQGFSAYISDSLEVQDYNVGRFCVLKASFLSHR